VHRALTAKTCCKNPYWFPKDGTLSSRCSSRPTDASRTGGIECVGKDELPPHIRVLFENIEELLWSLVGVAAMTYGAGMFFIFVVLGTGPANFEFPFVILFLMGLT
jgi:hypothetical protein